MRFFYLFICGFLICLSGVLALENSSDVNNTVGENMTREDGLDVNESKVEEEVLNETQNGTSEGVDSNLNETAELNESFKKNITEEVNDTGVLINESENETLVKNESDFIMNESVNLSVMDVFFEIMDYLLGSNHIINFFRSLVSYVDFSGNYVGNAIMSVEPLSKASGSDYSANVGYPGVGAVSDSIAPMFVFTNVSSSVIINGSNVTINANVYDNIQVDSIWGVVNAPSGANTSFSSLPYIFSNTTEIGRYNVTFYANDSSGNSASATNWFEIAMPLNTTLNISISSGNFTFRLIHPEAEDMIFEIEAGDAFQLEIPDVIYNVEFSEVFNATMNLTLRGVNLSASMNKSINLDKHRQLTDSIVVYGVDTNYLFDIAEVVFGYAGETYATETNLQLWKCDNYDFDRRSCSGSWTDVTSSSTRNTTGNYFIYNTTTFSGFSIKEYVAAITTAPGGGGGGGSSCGLGYRLVNGSCVKIDKESQEQESDVIPEKLFDIKMDLREIVLKNSGDLEAVIRFESFGTVPTSVNLTFIVLDAEGNEVYQAKGNITVITEEVIRWRFGEEGLGELPDGDYIAVLQTLYNVDVYDEFSQNFRVVRGSGFFSRIIEFLSRKSIWWIVPFVIVLLGLFWFVFWKRKRRLNGILKERSEIKKDERELKFRKSQLKLKEDRLKRINLKLKKLRAFGFGLKRKRKGLSRKISDVWGRVDKLERKRGKVVKSD